MPYYERNIEPYDYWAWARRKAADELDMPEAELADEPDYLPIDDQPYEEEEDD